MQTQKRWIFTGGGYAGKRINNKKRERQEKLVLLEISIKLQMKLSLLEAEIGKQVGLCIIMFYAKQALKSL